MSAKSEDNNRLLFGSLDQQNAERIIEELVKVRQSVHNDKFHEIQREILLQHSSKLISFAVKHGDKFLRSAGFAERDILKCVLQDIVLQSFPEFSNIPDLLSGSEFGKELLAEFKLRGIVSLGKRISESQLSAIFSYLSDKPVFNAHIAACADKIPRLIGNQTDPAEVYQFGAYDEDVIARMPFVEKIVLNPALLNFLKNYFGVSPVLRALYLWWSFPNSTKVGPQPFASQGFHRDVRSLLDVRVFVCLTDLPGTEGAHEYLSGTHDPRVFATQYLPRLHRDGKSHDETIRHVFFPPGDGYGDHPGDRKQDNEWLRMLGDLLIRLPIRAGESFMIDTMGLHRGLASTTQPRLVFSARFGAMVADPDVYSKRYDSPSTRTLQDELSYQVSSFKSKLRHSSDVEWCNSRAERT